MASSDGQFDCAKLRIVGYKGIYLACGVPALSVEGASSKMCARRYEYMCMSCV